MTPTDTPYQVTGWSHYPHWRLAVSSHYVYGGHCTMHRSKLLDPTVNTYSTVNIIGAHNGA